MLDSRLQGGFLSAMAEKEDVQLHATKFWGRGSYFGFQIFAEFWLR